MYIIKKLSFTSILLCFAVILHAQSTDSFNLDEQYSINPEGTLSLSSDDAEVTIIGSDRTDVHVQIRYKLDVTGFSFGKRNKFDMEVREINGDLRIRELPRDFEGVTFGSTDEEYTIRIEAPPGVSLELDGDDERYDIRSINGEIDIDADDSEVNLASCGSERFTFDLDDGSITMDEGRGSLEMDVDDGEADIRNGTFNNINISSDDGDFSIETTLTDDGSYDVDMDDGDLELLVTGGGGTFNIQHDDADISADSAFERMLDEENESEYRLPGGSAMFRIQADDTDIGLRSSR